LRALNSAPRQRGTSKILEDKKKKKEKEKIELASVLMPGEVVAGRVCGVGEGRVEGEKKEKEDRGSLEVAREKKGEVPIHLRT